MNTDTTVCDKMMDVDNIGQYCFLFTNFFTQSHKNGLTYQEH